jgi:hypothetical protein
MTMIMPKQLMIANFILFQTGWFACVLGGASQLGVAGSLVALLVAANHLWWADSRAAELRLLGSALLMGLCFESALVLSGLAIYSNGLLFGHLAPHWMLMMWVVFATTINVSMRWLKALHIGWAALLGAILAPLSYLAGSRLGAVTFSDPLIALSVIALGWAVLLPLLVIVARYFDGYAGLADSKRSVWRSVNV